MRLARREVRRRPGRTLLVMLLDRGAGVRDDGRDDARARQHRLAPPRPSPRQFGAADLVRRAVRRRRLRRTRRRRRPSRPAPGSCTRTRRQSDLGLALPDGTARLADGHRPRPERPDRARHRAGAIRPPPEPRRRGAPVARARPRLPRAVSATRCTSSSPNWTEKVVGIGVRAVSWNDPLRRGARQRAEHARRPTTADSPAPITLVDLPGHPTLRPAARRTRPPYIQRRVGVGRRATSAR